LNGSRKLVFRPGRWDRHGKVRMIEFVLQQIPLF
jgi:hypothetical protein